jgi:hypothetical protein
MALTRPKAAQVDFDVTNLTDPLIRINSGQSGSNNKDVGVVFERGSDTNTAMIWDESVNQFAFINTTETGSTSGDVTISSYADIKANAFYGDGSNLTGVTSYGDSDVASYLSTNGYSTSSSIIASITDSAPTTLDTLNELAAALGDDANFSTTVTNSIATKLPLAGGTMSGDIALGSNDITGVNLLRIDQTGTGLRMTNVGAFDNDGSNNFRIFATSDLQLKANGDSGGGLTIDATNNDVTIDNDLRVSAGQFYYGGTAVTSTAAELNILDGVTATTAELNVLDGMFDSTAATQIIAMNASNNGFVSSGMIFNSSTTSLGIGVASASDIDARLHIVGTGTANTGEVMFKVNNSNDHDRIEFIDEGVNTSMPSALRNNGASLGLGIISVAGAVKLYSGGSTTSDIAIEADSSGVQFSGAYRFPTSDGSANQVLQTDGAGALTFADASGGSGGGSGLSYPNSTFSTLPGTNGDFDLAKNVAQTVSETPFEATGNDAFGVSLGSVFTLMDPVGSLETDSESGLDLGVLT